MTIGNEASRTDWSLLHLAAGASSEREDAWTLLTRRYWPAIFAFIRAAGFDAEAASELTQAFVCDVMLHRGLVERADPARGRFRNLLMTSLRRYLIDVRRRDGVRRHHEPQAALQRAAEGSDMDVDRSNAAFTLAFVSSVVRKVIDDVRTQCEADGLATHWKIFQARVLRPLMTGAKPAAYGALAKAAGVRSPAEAANMVLTVKRRLARAVSAEIAATIGEGASTEDELYALLRDVETTS